MGIAYQQNIGVHPFEDYEEQRYIKFVRAEVLGIVPDPAEPVVEEGIQSPDWITTDP